MDNYNGWTNWDTWNANLWLSNDEHTESIMRRYAGRSKFAEVAKEQLTELDNPDNIDFDEINFEELEESFNE